MQSPLTRAIKTKILLLMTVISLVAHTSTPELGPKPDMMDGANAESQTPAVLPRTRERGERKANSLTLHFLTLNSL